MTMRPESLKGEELPGTVKMFNPRPEPRGKASPTVTSSNIVSGSG